MRQLCASIVLLIASSLRAAEPSLSVGFGECDVTPTIDPKKPVYMAGFGNNRIATKVHDPIVARAVVLSDGTKKIALVSVDLVGLFYPVAEAVRKNSKGFEHVAVSSTHNHEGPDTLGLWGPNRLATGVDDDYEKFVIDGIGKAIAAAEKSMQPAAAKIGTASDASLLVDGRMPVVKHDELVAIRFEPANGNSNEPKPFGILVQWNCHPELMDDKNTEITADHVGYAVAHLKKKFDCPVAYFTGTVGGLMTNLNWPAKNDEGKELKDGTFEKTEAYGVAVGKLAEKALAKPVEAKLVPFDIRTQPILIPVENNLYKVAAGAGIVKRKIYAWDGEATPKEWIEVKDVSKPVALKTEVGLLKLGELDIAMIPGEIYPELVLDKIQDPVDAGADYPDATKEPAIYPAMTGKFKMLFGLANDEIGYIIPKRQWDEKKPYCYGLKEAQYGEIKSCGPNVAMVIGAQFGKLAAKK